LAFLSLVLAHCAHKGASQDDAEGLYQEAEEQFKDEKYLTALEKYRDIKNRFPYSSRAADAELRIADTHFAQENFIEAASSYEVFRELHPTHPKSDYVQYRIGLSYFQQIPENSARDLSAAHKAIEAFNTVIQRFPSSTFVAEAKTKILESRHKLAEHERYVADFYFQRRHYLSASYRYTALLQEFPDMGYDEEALYRLGKCFRETRNFANAKDALRRLINRYPSSSYRSEAQTMLDEINSNN